MPKRLLNVARRVGSAAGGPSVTLAGSLGVFAMAIGDLAGFYFGRGVVITPDEERHAWWYLTLAVITVVGRLMPRPLAEGDE